ncbi:FecR domain-containing protein [Mucilaginibacter sp. RB4R14]|uniref:FecR family protein n=1 Tax=Mucilaginibacter aurantiaciroseus TaxID=2949308 RepID=UPI002090BF2E|nr:FecR domain-containing protein [Mucilaginibacter aurantiaciroseus]
MRYNEEIKKLFKLYLEGKASRQQEEVLLRFLGSGKNDDKQFSELIEKAWAAEPSSRADSYEIDQEFKEIMIASESKQQKRILWIPVWKYAASIVFVCSVALGWYSYHKNQVKAIEVIEMLSRSTTQGEKIKIILSDSTIVYLGSSSKLTWPSHFVKAHYRNIHLEGEGFFQVKRDTLSPFIVHSGNMQTRVLGTSFNISAYTSDNIFSISVRTGKVRVSENTKGVLKSLSLLTPGMKLDYNNHNHHYLVNTTKVEDVNSWTTNRFIFKDANLLTMLGKLERYYKVRFDLKSPCLANSRRFNATFDKKNIKDIMEQLRMMSGEQIHYKIINDTLITIWGEGCK